jgi:autotransporter translocation and assembly factor TamB
LAGNKTGLDFAVDIDRLNYNNFDIFVARILSELGGWAEAHLKIKGATDAPQVRGKMQLHETFFTPALTNVRYQLSETPLEFTESGLSLDGLHPARSRMIKPWKSMAK